MSTSSAKASSTGWLGRKLTSVSVLPLLLCLLAIVMLSSVTIGRYGLSVRDVGYILIDNIHPLVTPYWDPVQETVVEQVRLPRILAAVVIGYGLSISGAALQGLFRNPLVDPGIIGVTAGPASAARWRFSWDCRATSCSPWPSSSASAVFFW